MTGAQGPSPDSAFNLVTIGPEPSGATPLEQEDLEGLIPDFVATRADLNLVEFENIARALPWARRGAIGRGPLGVLDSAFLMAVHRRMFGDVWKWAGTQRRRLTNIGVEPSLIAAQTRLALDDAIYWHMHATFDTDELSARIHARLVAIHPFPNGNGRATRLMADLYRAAVGVPPFPWGSARLDLDGTLREIYIASLIKAIDRDDYSDLIRFATGRH
jgi:Fic-DOC domain mobile mystery protein B